MIKKGIIKLCKTCNTAPRHTGRTICIDCINQKTKYLAMTKIKKDNAYSKIHIRISGIEDEDREEIRDKLRYNFGQYLGKKQIVIKLSRGKVKSELQKLEKKADDLWSKKVKENYNNKCVYCGTSENLNSHHVFTRSRRSTRWDIDNGICLCSNHHTFSQEFSAHKTPSKFMEWFISLKGERFVKELEKKSREIFKGTEDIIKEKIEQLNNFLK